MSYLTQLGNPGKSKYLLTAMFGVKMLVQAIFIVQVYGTSYSGIKYIVRVTAV